MNSLIKLTVQILDTKTGKIGEMSTNLFDITENNDSCDCNRDLWDVFDFTGYCIGSKRFLVVAVKESKDIYDGYTLKDFNYRYPEELIAKHIKE